MKNKKNSKTEISKYAWLSLLFALFFWIPIINVFFLLPASIYFGTKAIKKTRKEPEKYRGFLLAVCSTIFASLSFVYGAYILVISINAGI